MSKKPSSEDEQASAPRDTSEEGASPLEPLHEGARAAAHTVQREVAATHRPWYRTIRIGRILLGVYAVLLISFGLLAWWVHVHPVLAIDVTITRDFQLDQAPWLRDLMLAVSFIGNYFWLSAGLVVCAALLFWIGGLRLEALTIIGVSASSALLNYLIKYIVARPRPPRNLVDIVLTVHGTSFPSGHVMSYVAFWGLLFSFAIILFQDHRWWRIALLVVSALFVVLVGPSRIYLGAHWASDVLGAYILGGVWLGLSLTLYLRLRARGVLEGQRSLWLSRKPGQL